MKHNGIRVMASSDASLERFITAFFADAIPIRGKFIVIVPITQKEMRRINEYNECILYNIYVNIKKGTCKWTKLFLVIAQILFFSTCNLNIMKSFQLVLPNNGWAHWAISWFFEKRRHFQWRRNVSLLEAARPFLFLRPEKDRTLFP